MPHYTNHLEYFHGLALSTSCRQIYKGMLKGQFCESDHICYDEHGDACDCSNFLDVDWLSSSGHSCEEELLER